MNVNYCFDMVKPGTFEMKYMGGEKELLRIQAFMHELEKGLKPCPFCGARARIRGTFYCASPGVMVQCPQCTCCTTPRYTGHDYLTDEDVTLEQNARDVVKIWNRRTDGGHHVSV